MSAESKNHGAAVSDTLMLHLRSLRQSPSIRGMASVFILKALIVASSFALLTLAARVLGETEFGNYSILFSAVGLFCVVAAFGQQIFVMRAWNEYASANNPALLKGALLFTGGALVLGGAVVGGLFAFVLAGVYAPSVVVATTLFLLALAASQISSHLVRTAIGVGAGDGYGNLLLMLPAVFYLLACHAGYFAGDVAVILLLFSAGGVAALAIHTVMILRQLRVLFPDLRKTAPQYDTRSWSERSLKLWISTGLEASNQYVDVLIIGYLMSPAVAGAYFVTTRLANVFATASDAVHMFSTRHIPDMYYRRDFVALNALLDSVSRMASIIIGVGLVVLIGSGYWLLATFNPAYASYFYALVLLSVGTSALAAVGPCGPFLMLTGHEGSYLRIIAASVILRAALFFLLIPSFGVAGAVVATTVSFLLMAVALRRATKKFAGIDGSVTRLLPQNFSFARPFSLMRS